MPRFPIYMHTPMRLIHPFSLVLHLTALLVFHRSSPCVIVFHRSHPLRPSTSCLLPPSHGDAWPIICSAHLCSALRPSRPYSAISSLEFKITLAEAKPPAGFLLYCLFCRYSCDFLQNDVEPRTLVNIPAVLAKRTLF